MDSQPVLKVLVITAPPKSCDQNSGQPTFMTVDSPMPVCYTHFFTCSTHLYSLMPTYSRFLLMASAHTLLRPLIAPTSLWLVLTRNSNPPTCMPGIPASSCLTTQFWGYKGNCDCLNCCYSVMQSYDIMLYNCLKFQFRLPF